jgi:hypothetical protein
MEYKMIPANKDNSIMIKENDRYCYHVKLERRAVRPGNEQYPEISHHVKCFKKDVYEKMEALNRGRNPINWVRAGGFVAAKVIHDPNLEEKEPERIDTSDTDRAKRDEEKKAKQKERMKIANAAKKAKREAEAVLKTK